jgi:hypothetical protein
MRGTHATATQPNGRLPLMVTTCRRVSPRSFVLAVLLALGLGLVARADDQPPTPAQLRIQVDILNDQIANLQNENAQLRKNAINPALYDPYLNLMKSRYAYEASLMNATVEAFFVQRIASYVVLVLVVIVVLAGILFSGFQLWKSAAVAGVQPTNELEISASKVRITSSVVGIVVLTISIVFLFIYTHEIYHIKFMDNDNQPNSEVSSQKPK